MEVLTRPPDTRLLGYNCSCNFLAASGLLQQKVSLIRWTSRDGQDREKDDRSAAVTSQGQATASQGSPKGSGLKNLGNTCFMNSVLQCLAHTKPLVLYCLTGQYKQHINPVSSMKGSLISAFAQLVESMSLTDELVIPAEFKGHIAGFARQFVGHSQQDAQEFLICALEGLHEDTNRAPDNFGSLLNDRQNHCIADGPVEAQQYRKTELASECWKQYLMKDDSCIVDSFAGVLRSTLTCDVCQHVSHTFEPFLDLSLPISTSNEVTKPSTATLLDCLKLLVQQEILDAENRPECDQCKQRQRCTKSFSIDRFPPILVLHLKRFNRVAKGWSKLTTNVQCPLHKLDLTGYAIRTNNASAVYNLFAVCNHQGSPLDGHYTASARNMNTGQWFSFDDARVRPIDESDVITSDAYILFYELSATTSSRL